MRLLSTDAKILIGQAMLRLIRIGFAGRMEWADRPFGDFLTETGQSDDARRLFWDPVVISACNLPCDQVAGNHAMQVFQESFLSGGWQATMGLATCDLRSLYDPAISAVETAGGMVRLGNSVRGIAFDGIRANGVVTDEGLISAAAIISTVPPDRLAKLVSRPMLAADPRLANLHRFEHSPILGVHLFFESPVLVDDTRTYPHLVLPGRATHWFFNKGQDESGLHHVHAVISAADDWMDLDESAITARVLKDLHWALPGSRGLMPIEVRSVKEKRATFRASPGIDSIRPSARPGGFGVPNLFLAGDWCDTGWPATMEGAARSGYAAAAAVTGVGGVIRDVPAGPLARWMGLR
jgi:zeta-carotene desaturase